MQKVDSIATYNLVDPNGNVLLLHLGMMTNGERPGASRIPVWSFEGNHIPMPVRSHTWFNGFKEEVMLNWLKDHGWALRAIVNMSSGRATVIDLPTGESSKGNEEYKLSEAAITNGENALKIAINDMCNQGCILQAVSLYRLAHPCSLVDAKHAVDAIRFDNAT